jgi:hypothetical protein
MIDMSTVWDRATAFAGSARRSLLPVVALLLFMPTAIQLAIEPALVAPWRGIAMVALWLATLTGSLAVMVLALGATVQPGEAIRAALARLPAAVGILILLGILAGLAALPLVMAMHWAGMDFAAMRDGQTVAAPSMSAGLAIFVTIYAIAFVVAMIAITARLIVIEPVILAERRGVGAIGRTFALTRGLTWRIVGVLILYEIVSTVAVLAARLVFGGLFGLIGGDGAITVGGVLTALIVAAVSAGFETMAAIFVARLYAAIGAVADGVPDRS